MTPALAEFLDKDPDFVPLVRLFHLNFGSTQYWLNETEVPLTFAGQVWAPSYGAISADPLKISPNPFDANPAYYTAWKVGSREGELLAYEALNNPAVWSGKLVRQLWAVRGFPADAIVMHVGRIVDVKPKETAALAQIRIRTETIAAYRNYTPLGEYTDRDQQRRSPGDLGCQYAASLVGKKIKGWLVG
ncbi:hypothetical protein [Paracoccus laeviglucosivorans]|uniref:Uncharacterized protein n=1 Tax=Paracoccus laeviglucosivorans TaxID=1197861 RepID=A0A521E424_9RHOB|nr:hypothetical protein [Paracoccus laeviglucosivorans]SMO78689.1 hypothetical protein SAMN06265221_11145 [Paracoccus laeviglucosivorans]